MVATLKHSPGETAEEEGECLSFGLGVWEGDQGHNIDCIVEPERAVAQSGPGTSTGKRWIHWNV
jgi:hypothetical protein